MVQSIGSAFKRGGRQDLYKFYYSWAERIGHLIISQIFQKRKEVMLRKQNSEEASVVGDKTKTLRKRRKK